MAPNYNPLQLRSYIDDVDAVLRAAAEAGSLEQTFEAERSRTVRFFFLIFYFFFSHSFLE